MTVDNGILFIFLLMELFFVGLEFLFVGDIRVS